MICCRKDSFCLYLRLVFGERIDCYHLVSLDGRYTNMISCGGVTRDMSYSTYDLSEAYSVDWFGYSCCHSYIVFFSMTFRSYVCVRQSISTY